MASRVRGLSVARVLAPEIYKQAIRRRQNDERDSHPRVSRRGESGASRPEYEGFDHESSGQRQRDAGARRSEDAPDRGRCQKSECPDEEAREPAVREPNPPVKQRSESEQLQKESESEVGCPRE